MLDSPTGQRQTAFYRMNKKVLGPTAPVWLDHLFVICSIISTRKLNKSPTFVAFVDLKKAFDSVDRDLLWHRLGHYGISGKFLDLIKCLYRDTEYCVRVNDTITEPFPVTSGVKQGCLLPYIIQSLHHWFN